MKTYLHRERGQTLVIIALAAIGLFAVVGLAIDGSAKFSDRRHAQNAADTAALAGALAKVNALTNGVSDLSPTTGAVANCPPPDGVLPSPVCEATLLAALDQAETNGYAGDLVASKVEVYSPPISGYYVGNDSYVQVIITSTVNTYFARVIGIRQTKNTVQAVALTQKGGPLFNGASIVSVNPNPNCSSGAGSGGGSVDVGGNGSISLNGGGIFVNADGTCGYSQTSCTVDIEINGGGVVTGGSPVNLNGCAGSIPTSTSDPVIVPDEIYMPDTPPECSTTAATPTLQGTVWHIYPGYYTDFPQAGLIANNKSIYMEPGVYCVNGDVHWSGATFTSLDGSSGVTIFITSGHDFSLSINSPISLNASNSGEYAGYLVILDGNHNNIENCTINGGSYLQMNGTIFAPYCNITINGDNTTNSEFNAQIIGYDIKLNGNNSLTFNYNPGDNAQTRRRIGLMR